MIHFKMQRLKHNNKLDNTTSFQTQERYAGAEYVDMPELKRRTGHTATWIQHCYSEATAETTWFLSLRWLIGPVMDCSVLWRQNSNASAGISLWTKQKKSSIISVHVERTPFYITSVATKVSARVLSFFFVLCRAMYTCLVQMYSCHCCYRSFHWNTLGRAHQWRVKEEEEVYFFRVSSFSRSVKRNF